jgi:hypothetical protein
MRRRKFIRNRYNLRQRTVKNQKQAKIGVRCTAPPGINAVVWEMMKKITQASPQLRTRKTGFADSALFVGSLVIYPLFLILTLIVRER